MYTASARLDINLGNNNNNNNKAIERIFIYDYIYCLCVFVNYTSASSIKPLKSENAMFLVSG